MKRIFLALAMLLSLASAQALAQALPCAAYPNTLTNGTLADANQVMANFNTIRNCVNGLAPLAVPVVGSSSNIKASNASAGTTITVTADTVTVGTALNGTAYTLTSYSGAFNGATNGANGMDTGSLPTSGWVALYAIYNPSAPSTAILGTNCSTSCPTVYAGGSMPAGYTASALLTTLPTNGTPAIPAGVYVKGKRVGIPGTTVLSTSTGHGSFTSLSLASAVPPNAVTVSGILESLCGSTASNVGTNVTVSSDSGGQSGQQESGTACLTTAVMEILSSFADLPMPTAQTLFYENSVSGTSPTSAIFVSSYLLP